MTPTQKKIWILWRYETVNGKPTKVPYQANNKKASTTDPATWSTLEEVEKHRDRFDGIGFCFDGSTLGIDLDHVLEQPLTPEVERLLDEANTYIEISPSGTGLHIIFNLTEPFEPEANKHKNEDGTIFECYSTGRYFTFTKKPHEKTKPVRSIDAVEATHLLSILGYPWKKTSDKPSHKPNPNLLDDMDLMKKMVSAHNGKQIQALWEGDTSHYNSDASSADMALCLHLAFWTGNDAERIERLWLMSPLGQREKTQSRPDYRQITIKNAIERTSDVYDPEKTKIPMRGSIVSPLQPNDPEFIEMKLQRNKNGTPHNNLVNALAAFESHPAYANTVKFNSFRLQIEVNGRPLEEKDIMKAQQFLQMEIGLSNVSKATAGDALILHAHKNTYDEAIDWLKSLEWDGVPRLEHWLIHSCNVEPSLYHRAIGAQWLMAMVNRLVHPGAIFDHVLTMYGTQGIGKTSFFRIIGGDWYKAHTEGVDNKDFFLKLRGACLIDLDEGATMYKSDSIKLKSIVTETCDEFRAPYERVTQKYPRRFIFSMSTNDPEPLKDQTGNRRYWILRVESQINFKWLEENRTQLFAEAYHAVKNKVAYPEVPLDVATQLQNESSHKDSWVNAIADRLSDNPGYRQGDSEFKVTIQQVYQEYLGGEDIIRLDRSTEMRISNILANEFKMHRVKKMVDGKRKYFYQLTPKECQRLKEEYEADGSPEITPNKYDGDI